MNSLKIKKIHPDAVIPTRAYENSNGLDLTAVSCTMKNNYIEYSLGLAISLPKNHIGLIFPRSSVSNYDQTLANSVAVIDENFSGELTLRFRYTKENNKFLSHLYKKGDKVAQLLVVPNPQFNIEVVTELEQTSRGTKGFGSSGL